MRTVRLPIYDEAGDETPQCLEIDITFFISSIRGLRNTQCRVVDLPTPEQEKEMIDRIIAGLPTRPFFEEFNVEGVEYYPVHGTIDSHMQKTLQEKAASAHYRLHEDGTVDKLVKHENLEWGPPVQPNPDNMDSERLKRWDVNNPETKEWRLIPHFSKYKMNRKQRIVDAATERSVSIVKGGRLDNALLEGDDGTMKRMSVKFLFNVTFPRTNP